MENVVDFQFEKDKKKLEELLGSDELEGPHVDLSSLTSAIYFVGYGSAADSVLEDKLRIAICEKPKGEEAIRLIGAITVSRVQWEELKEVGDRYFRRLREVEDAKKE